MNTDPALNLGQQLAQMLGSLWSQAKLGLEVGLESEKPSCRNRFGEADQYNPSSVHSPFCEWSGNLGRNGLGSLDIGGKPRATLE